MIQKISFQAKSQYRLLPLQLLFKRSFPVLIAIFSLGVFQTASAQENPKTIDTMQKKKVTAGRDNLGELAPKFAEINDDVLFGQVWSREAQLSARDRSLITVAGLIGSGILDQSLQGHLSKAKENGVTREEIFEVITHLAFYTGWPKAWTAFYLVKDIYNTEEQGVNKTVPFGVGQPNTSEYSKNFKGKTYVNPLVTPKDGKKLMVTNVTFEPAARNNWHQHPGGQILLITEGLGWYQEEGKPARGLKPGDVVEIAPNTKHWHGAAKENWFTHIAIEPDVTKGAPVWFDAVTDEAYNKL